ncbi:4999_t:CDS:2, partial [Dentiscutata heterogama]
GKSSSFAREIYKYLDSVELDNLKWQNPLASQVITDEFVQNLSKESGDGNVYKSFKEPLNRMRIDAPSNIREICNNHITSEILEYLSDIWRNPAFEANIAKTQSEGTYVTDVIVPLLRASLKKLPIRNTAFLSTAERQSQASADRKGGENKGKRPDIMLIEEYDGKLYELIFAECSRLICPKRKEDDDKIKLWREMNDGLYWTYSGCRPDINQFGVIRVQIAGDTLHLKIIIKDMNDIHHLYNLYSVKIPVRPTDGES